MIAEIGNDELSYIKKQNHNIMPWKIWAHTLSSKTFGWSGMPNGRD